MLTTFLIIVAVAAPVKVDTSKWETKALSSLGKQPFSFKASLKLPRKSKSTSSSYTVGGKPGGAMAYVDLPSGVRVILMQRSENAMNDPTMTAQVLAMSGKVLEVRKGATSYMIFVEQAQGLVIQGATWAVMPGLDCATEKPLTVEQAEEVTAICESLAASAR
jgi:hypothetical protein